MIDLTAEEEEPVIEIDEVFSLQPEKSNTQEPIVIEDDYPECIDVESYVNDVEIVEDSCRPPSEVQFPETSEMGTQTIEESLCCPICRGKKS